MSKGKNEKTIETYLDGLIAKAKKSWEGVNVEDYMNNLRDMDKIPKNEQNTAYLSSIPLKIYERGEYSELLVPRVGEEVGGVYYSGKDKFEMKGVVTRVFYNTDINWIVVSCKCTNIQKLK